MSDLPTETAIGRERTYEPEELGIEANDEEVVRKSRERSTARIRLLWMQRRLLFRTAVGGLLLSTAIAFLIPKQYQSTAALMPPDDSMGSGTAMLAALSTQLGGSLASLAQSALGMNTTGDMFVGVLNSDTVKDDLIRKFNLQEVYRKRYIEDTRKKLASRTRISEDQKTGIITISVSDHDPQRAEAMAQEYVNELNWVVAHLTTSAARRERIFLDQRLEQVKADLETAEKQFSQFASQKGAIDIPNQGKAMVTAAATLQGELIAAESELQGLRQIYTDNNVRVRSSQARVNELRSSLSNIAGKGANKKSSAKELFPSISQLPVLGVTYADLLRRAKVQEAIFETLTQQDELAKVQEAKEVPTVNVLDRPLVPQKKSFPPRLIIMFLGTCLVLALGVTCVLGRALWDETSPQDPRKVLALEVLETTRAKLPWPSRNGSRLKSPTGWFAGRFRRPEDGRADEQKSDEVAQK